MAAAPELVGGVLQVAFLEHEAQHPAQAVEAHDRIDAHDLVAALIEEHQRGRVEESQLGGPIGGGGAPPGRRDDGRFGFHVELHGFELIEQRQSLRIVHGARMENVAGVTITLLEKHHQRRLRRLPGTIENEWRRGEEILLVEITQLEFRRRIGACQVVRKALLAIVAVGDVLEGGAKSIGRIVAPQSQRLVAVGVVENQRRREVGLLAHRVVPLGEHHSPGIDNLAATPDIDADHVEVALGVATNVLGAEIGLYQRLAVGTVLLMEVHHQAAFAVRPGGHLEIVSQIQKAGLEPRRLFHLAGAWCVVEFRLEGA